MTPIYHYTCPSCNHTGSSTQLKHGHFCPDCQTDVPAAIRQSNFKKEVIRQVNLNMLRISGAFRIVNGKVRHY